MIGNRWDRLNKTSEKQTVCCAWFLGANESELTVFSLSFSPPLHQFVAAFKAALSIETNRSRTLSCRLFVIPVCSTSRVPPPSTLIASSHVLKRLWHILSKLSPSYSSYVILTPIYKIVQCTLSVPLHSNRFSRMRKIPNCWCWDLETCAGYDTCLTTHPTLPPFLVKLTRRAFTSVQARAGLY